MNVCRWWEYQRHALRYHGSRLKSAVNDPHKTPSMRIIASSARHTVGYPPPLPRSSEVGNEERPTHRPGLPRLAWCGIAPRTQRFRLPLSMGPDTTIPESWGEVDLCTLLCMMCVKATPFLGRNSTNNASAAPTARTSHVLYWQAGNTIPMMQQGPLVLHFPALLPFPFPCPR